MSKTEKGDVPFHEKILMEEMTNETDMDLATLANSWLSAHRVNNVTGCETLGYNKEQRAYVLSTSEALTRFAIDASEKSPIDNICLAMKIGRKGTYSQRER